MARESAGIPILGSSHQAGPLCKCGACEASSAGTRQRKPRAAQMWALQHPLADEASTLQTAGAPTARAHECGSTNVDQGEMRAEGSVVATAREGAHGVIPSRV